VSYMLHNHSTTPVTPTTHTLAPTPTLCHTPFHVHSLALTLFREPTHPLHILSHTHFKIGAILILNIQEGDNTRTHTHTHTHTYAYTHTHAFISIYHTSVHSLVLNIHKGNNAHTHTHTHTHRYPYTILWNWGHSDPQYPKGQQHASAHSSRAAAERRRDRDTQRCARPLPMSAAASKSRPGTPPLSAAPVSCVGLFVCKWVCG